MTTVVEPFPFIEGIVYGEGPRWHNGRLWFTDGSAGHVYSRAEAGDLAVEAEVAHASGLGWLPDGTLVVSTLFDTKVHCVDAAGKVTATFDHSDLVDSTNDLLVAPDGRTYIDLYQASGGAIGFIDSSGGSGSSRPGSRCRMVLASYRTDRLLVVSETRGSRILCSRPNPTAAWVPKRFRRSRPERHPDGLCVDVEGGVWVGCVDTGEFLRVLAGGVVTHRVAIDRGWAVAPALGGADGCTLYMVIDDTTYRGRCEG